jgi:hypothetical protein
MAVTRVAFLAFALRCGSLAGESLEPEEMDGLARILDDIVLDMKEAENVKKG